MVVAGWFSIAAVIFCSLKPVYCDGPILFKAITVVDLCEQCRQLQGCIQL